MSSQWHGRAKDCVQSLSRPIITAKKLIVWFGLLLSSFSLFSLSLFFSFPSPPPSITSYIYTCYSSHPLPFLFLSFFLLIFLFLFLKMKGGRLPPPPQRRPACLSLVCKESTLTCILSNSWASVLPVVTKVLKSGMYFCKIQIQKKSSKTS